MNLFRYAGANPLRNSDSRGLVCGIDWWSDNIGGIWGQSPIDHRFVTWPTGALGFQPNGGQAAVTFAHGGIGPIPGHVSLDIPNPAYDTKHETYFDDAKKDSCRIANRFGQCLDDFAKQFEATTNQWCVMGNNCHTAFDDALSACGLSRTAPPTAPTNCATVNGKQVCAGTGI